MTSQTNHCRGVSSEEFVEMMHGRVPAIARIHVHHVHVEGVTPAICRCQETPALREFHAGYRGIFVGAKVSDDRGLRRVEDFVSCLEIFFNINLSEIFIFLIY